MIVDLVTQDQLVTAYRFYGARHSVVGLGNMVNFELEQNTTFMPRLRDLMHLGFDWLLDRQKLYIWQQFIKLFYPHLKDATHLDDFYYELLYQSAKKFSKQNPKRVVVESYIKLLDYEGRLHLEKSCYLCHEAIGESMSLIRAFLPVHKECVFGSELQHDRVYEMLQSGKTINLNDDEVEYLYGVVLKGF